MSRPRPLGIEVDLGAVRHNVGVLRRAAPEARVMAVVKADGYGHGAVPVARAAVDAGATWLGVARVGEGATLRAAGIDTPTMLLADPPPEAAGDVLAHDLVPLVGEVASIEPLAHAARAAGRTLEVHCKVDTGMHRIGVRPEAAVDFVRAVDGCDALRVGGVATHLAVADEPDDDFTAHQLDVFDRVLAELEEAGLRPPLAHAANSAGTLGHPRSHHDLVRTGIAVYGLPPGPEAVGIDELRPALSWRLPVTGVRDLEAGARISYGRRYALPAAGRVVTVPAGYADGVPRRLGAVGGEAVVHGRRCPVAGTVTMDQLMVDVGDLPVDLGDEVTLLGHQRGPDGAEAEVRAAEWARRLDTIDYEIVAAIRHRIPRTYSG